MSTQVYFACTSCSALYEADQSATSTDIKCWTKDCDGIAVRLPDNPRMKWMRDILDYHEDTPGLE